MWRTGDFSRSSKTENEQVEHESIVLDNEGGELKTTNNAEGVRVIHILVIDHHVVLRSHVIRNVVIDDEPKSVS